MSCEHRVEEHVVHGLTWQIILTDWGCHQAEANLAFAAVCAQLETLHYRDAVYMHAMMLKNAAIMVNSAGKLPDYVEWPFRAIEIERAARRAAIGDWPNPPRDTHRITLGAIPS